MDNNKILNHEQLARLAILIEELNNTKSVIWEILKCGYDNYNPDKPKHYNKLDFEAALAQLLLAITLTIMNDNISPLRIKHFQKLKIAEINAQQQ